jgi:porin
MYLHHGSNKEIVMRRAEWFKVLVIISLGFVMTGIAFAEDAPGRKGKAGYKNASDFGGPASVGGLLEEDDALKEPAFRFPSIDNALAPWFEWKKGLNDKYGLQFEGAYTALYQSVSDVPSGAEDNAAVGIFRVLGRWNALGRGTKDTGTLVFSADNRHRLGTEIAPADLGFQGGYLGILGTLFSSVDTVLVDLNWQQFINNGRTGIMIGRYDPNDYLDVLGYANPWTSFQNLAILFNTSVALPDASFGIGAGHWYDDEIYALGTINDANGVVTEVEVLEHGPEFYKALEVGWTPSRAERYFKKLHLMGWHVDSREDAGIPEGYGITASVNWTYKKMAMVFMKAGLSDGDAPLMNKSVTIGGLLYIPNRSDLLGLALNWGDPSNGRLGTQLTEELFYRLQFAQNLAITPSIQLISDPALNPDEDFIWIMGLRARLTI